MFVSVGSRLNLISRRVPDNFRELQSSDVTLQTLFKNNCEADGKAVGVPRLGGNRYILEDNLLYLADTENSRLVVPSKLHEMILHLGHTLHLGQGT